MYRNDDKKLEWRKWEDRADIARYGSLGLIFAGIFLLESLPKEQARIVVWYWAAITFCLATTGFILGTIAHKYMKKYFGAEQNRISGLFDMAIEEAKGELPSECRCENPGQDDGKTTCWIHHDCSDGSCTHQDGGYDD